MKQQTRQQIIAKQTSQEAKETGQKNWSVNRI